MRKLCVILAVFACSTFFAGSARAQDTVEVFGGYSYLRPSLAVQATIVCPVGTLPPCPVTTTDTHPNLNGWEFSGVYNAYKWLGVVADFSGHHGTVDGASTHLNAYLFGPQVRFPGRVSPFAHLLLGGAHETVASSTTIPVIPSSASAFAAAVGAGIDIHVAPLVSFRPIQIDYLITRFGSSTQNQPRVSAGVVFHF
ncbi:MAG TPA: outer membrane beta-barrel protein [Candidatus Acidoferrum sp.]|nr:outer membrane beta-barrel protein [Candidatus Acidoferrum sp.]